METCKATLALQIYQQEDLDVSNDVLFRVLQLQYLNAGIKKGFHPVSWIGRTKYCKLEPEKSPINGRNCPECGRKLKLIYFDGKVHPLPLINHLVGYLKSQIGSTVLLIVFGLNYSKKSEDSIVK